MRNHHFQQDKHLILIIYILQFPQIRTNKVFRIRLSQLTISGTLHRRGRPEAPQETLFSNLEQTAWLLAIPTKAPLLLIHIATWPLAHELTH